MSEQKSNTVTIPFLNKGINQRVDPQLLADGEYQSMLNVCSVQEGAISSRSGYKTMGVSTGFDSPHTIRKLRISDTDTSNLRYIGENDTILRTTDYASFTSVAAGCNSQTDARAKRMAAVPYNAGTSGSPYMYFATPLKMLKDYGTSPYGTLVAWGLTAPTCPAIATLTSASEVTIATSTVAATVTTSSSNVIEARTVSSNLSQFTSLVPSGSVTTFYDSDDYIEVQLDISAMDSSNLLEQLQLDLNCSSTATIWADFYSKSIMPSEANDYILSVQNAQEADQAIEDPNDPYLAPSYLPPLYAASTDLKVKIPKTEFLKVGNAGTSGHNWSSINAIRILGKTSVGTVTVTADYVKMVGGSGPNAYAETARPYKYLYTYRNPTTGAESNPCVEMIPENAVYPKKQPVSVALYGTAQVTGAGSIAVYRSGGVLSDDYYRFVGYATNPGAGSSVAFVDGMADVDLKDRRTVDFDNDPPIPSYLPAPFQSSGVGGFGTAGWQTLTATFTPATAVTTVLSVGSTLQINDGANSEDAIVSGLTTISSGTGTIVLYAQRPHASTSSMSCDVRAASPAYLAASAYDSIWISGDDNNPHIVYRSKRGRPEAFPFAVDATGQVLQYAAGSPSNRVMNLTEFKGVVVALNQSSLYEITPDNEPREVVSGYGLYARHAWCKTENELWYLSHDGIYSWNGGLPQKRSEKVDWVFRNRTINGIAPLDWSQKDYMQMGYFRNKVHLLYKDINGYTKRLLYDTTTDRWTQDDKPFIALYVEEDTGDCIAAVYDASGGIIVKDDQYGGTLASGTSDGFTVTATATDGAGIAWSLKTPYYCAGDPSLRKLWQDAALEITKPDTACTLTANAYFDYATTAAASWTIGPGGTTISASRQLLPLPLGISSTTTYGQEAKAVSFEFACSATTQQCTLHSMQFTYAPLAQDTKGRVEDWTDLGYQWDKRLRQLVLDFDSKGQTITMSLDTMGGVDGSTTTTAVQTFSLIGRGQKSFQITDGTVAKKVRLRPNVPTSAFLLMRDPQWDFEQYPPDIASATDWEDAETPHQKRVILLDMDLNTNSIAVPFNVEYEGGTLQAFTATSTLSTRNQQYSFDSDKFAKKLRIVPGTVTSTGMFQLFGHRFSTIPQPPDTIETTEWEDCGSPYEKRMLTLDVEVDTNSIAVPFAVEYEGGTLQSFTVTATKATRNQQFSFDIDKLARKARLAVGTIPSNGRFQLFGHKFGVIEQPPDIVESTEPSDFGYPFVKYIQQVIIEANTNNQAVPVIIYGDGAAKQTITVTTTLGTRTTTVPLNPSISARKLWLKIDSSTIPATGRFQLWRWEPVFAPIDKGQIYHTTDWSDLGHPYDKKLKEVTIEFETNGTTVTAAVDLLTGVNGSTVSLAAQTLTLASAASSRAQKTFQLNGNVAKMVRLRSLGSGSAHSVDFKMWPPKWDFDPYPPDAIYATEWQDCGTANEKRFMVLDLDINTNNSAVPFAVEYEGGTLQAFTATSTMSTRNQQYSFDVDKFAKKVRIVPTLSDGTIFQLFDKKFTVVEQPPDVVESTEWEDVGSPHEKRFIGLDIECNTHTQAVPFVVEYESGTLQSFTITSTRATRNQQLSFDIDKLARKARLSVGTIPAGGRFQLFSHKFNVIEQPPDIVESTEPSEFGYPFVKYIQQIVLEANTNNEAVPVVIYGDGSAKQTITVTTTLGTRTTTVPLNPAISARKLWLKVDSANIPAGGRFQLWNWQPIFSPIDKGPVYHTFDWDDLGHPYDKRLKQVTLEFETNGTTITAAVDLLTGVHGSTASLTAQTLTMTSAASTRAQKAFPLDGHVAKMVRLRSLGEGGTHSADFKMWTPKWDFDPYPPDFIYATEWDDCGSPHEKRFMTLDLDVNTNSLATPFAVEYEGGTLQDFTVTSTMSTRRQQFSFDVDKVADKVRLLPTRVTGNTMFQLFDHKFGVIEQPPNVVESTEPSDFGYPFEKYIEQVILEVNTNNQAVPLVIYGDGAAKQTLTVTTTLGTRTKTIALNPSISARRLWLQVDSANIPSGGRFQLWNWQPIFSPVDKGPIYHTTDWNDLGHPYDKKLKEVTLEFETNGATVTAAVDLLTGINGNTVSLNAQTLTLVSATSSRAQKTFPLTEVVAKMVRIRSLGQGESTHAADFKMWQPKWDFDPYPADITYFTDWFDDGYHCDKIFRGIGLEVDTGGVAAVANLQTDGTTTATWTITSTATDRSEFLSPLTATEICGKRYRITSTPGTNGKFQLFKTDWKLLRDACEFVTFDTGMQAFGSAGYRYIKEIFFDYKCAGSVTISAYNSSNQLIHTETLAANSYRTPSRFYLPAVATTGGYFNKSTKHRILVQAAAATPVKIYRDSSRVEVMFMSRDARAPYLQSILWQDLPIAV